MPKSMIYQTRWIPKDVCETITHPDGADKAVVYVCRKVDGRPAAIAYTGKANKPAWHFIFRDMAGVQRKAADLFASVTARAESVKRLRDRRNQPHNIKVGAIIYNSWGYEQTNVDFYRVVKASAHYVWLRRLRTDVVTHGQDGAMAGRIVARVEFASETVTKHKAHGAYEAGGADSVSFEHGGGYVWDGDPKYCSWYA